MLICVTGKSGCGKSIFSRTLAKKINFKYIDVDEIGHRIYEDKELVEKLKNLFCSEIIGEDGSVDRKKLGNIVFSRKDSGDVQVFNELTWNYMEKLIDSERADNTILDWILLPKTKYWKEKCLKILIKAEDDKKRFEKIMSRDNLTEDYVSLRDKSAMEYNESEFDKIFISKYNKIDLVEMVEAMEDFIGKQI